MAGNDPLSNALSGLDNAEDVGHLTHTVEPASNTIGSVLEVLYDRGYVGAFERVEDGKSGKFDCFLHDQYTYAITWPPTPASRAS